jgi:hypothetical protein
LVVWGARTTSSEHEWRYINVRRLFLHVERSIIEGLEWVVFEPNDAPLWQSVCEAVTSFLDGLYLAGAFAGASPGEAYFVTCDRTTMTRADFEAGRLRLRVGFAPLKPAEFLVVEIDLATGGALPDGAAQAVGAAIDAVGGGSQPPHMAVFEGPAGTPKTIAAHRLAAAFDTSLITVDSDIVARYIGETEKNLRILLDSADQRHAVLFFDEADALFGKHGGSRESPEAELLIEAMHDHEGLVILALEDASSISNRLDADLTISFDPVDETPHRHRRLRRT